MRVQIAIQTHPLREPVAAELAATLAGQGADPWVVVDPAPLELRSPWRTYRHALEHRDPSATHLLIVQDDVMVCPGFVPAALSALEAQPERLVSFYVGGAPAESRNAMLTAGDRGDSWARLNANRWIPAVALAWPCDLIAPTLAFVDAQNWPASFRGDDEIIAHAVRAHGWEVLATVPSLVQHPDVVVSLIGLRAWAGKDPSRVACCYIGSCDPASIDWSLGPR